MKYSITTTGGLDNYLTLKKKSRAGLLVDIPVLTQKENIEYREKLNRLNNACGCDTGSLFLFTTAAFCIAAPLLNISLFKAAFPYPVLFSLALILFSALLGKVTGLLLAAIKLRVTVQQIKNKVKARGGVMAG